MDDLVRYDLVPESREPHAVMLETFDDNVNRSAKDSIFCDLFARPEYCLQMYKVLHPEDRNVKEENIVLVTLSNLLMKNQYNDLGILVRDKLLILVECQSTFAENILIRFIFYLADTYKKYINRMNLNIYGSKKIRLPVPELYVIYHGDREDRPEEISLSKDIFGAESVESVFMDVKAKMIYDSTPGDIINQFITFARVFDQQVQEFGRNRKAVEETLKICKNQDVLKKYLEETEASEIMFTWLDEQKAKKIEEEEIRQESEAKGESRLGSLITKLKDLGRTDDAFLAASNESYRKKLYQDFNIQ